MKNQFPEMLDQFLVSDSDEIVRVPMLVKGRLIYPPVMDAKQIVSRVENTNHHRAGEVGYAKFDQFQVLVQPRLSHETQKPSDEVAYLTFAAIQPDDLIETDFEGLEKGLYALSSSEILDYVGRLQETLQQHRDRIQQAVRRLGTSAILDSRSIEILFDQLPMLLDPESLGHAIDQDLGDAHAKGRDYLDRWVEVKANSARGVTAYTADHVFRRQPPRNEFRHRKRAVSTRQLHVTAGNSPLVPLISLMHGLATKGATVVKCPAEATAVAALLGIAMTVTAPDHPITKNTSLVYWKGGDARMEDRLFTSHAFDRMLVWGSPETVESVRKRASQTKAIYLNPRYGLSLLGGDAVRDNITEAAMRGCSDSMIANQQACTSSLVHYVQGDESVVLDYCQALQRALAQWDGHLPYSPPLAVLGRMRMLRRTTFLKGTWFENGKQPRISSAVVYMPEPFDLSVHPMSRLIVVRRIERIEDVVPILNSSVSTLGVWPANLIESIRDAASACGVNNILPLGECERLYPGMPHDGMKLLSELVNWSNA